MHLEIILLIVGIAWAEFLPNGCPEDHSVHRLLRHEDCTRFYSCTNGIPIEMQCAPGTGFDLDLQICNWLHLVNCTPNDKPTTTTTSRPITTASPPTTTASPPSPECPQLNWNVDTDCDVIKDCADYVKLKFNCPISMNKDGYNLFMEINFENPERTKKLTKMYAVAN